LDRQLNNWLHDYLYKKEYPVSLGKTMREKYEAGLIRNKIEFEEVLKNVLFSG
jgi:putative GTP pyrophosphokinase